MSITFYDVEDLAKIICDLKDEAEFDEVEQALYDKFEVSWEAFEKLVGVLAKMTPVAQLAVSGGIASGFVHNDFFIVKIEKEY